MNYQDLRNALRYEYKLKTGGYFSTDLVGFATTEVDIMANIEFVLSHVTYLVLTRSVSAEKTSFYTVNKIITMTRKGDVFEFKTIEEFVEYIKNHKDVEEIHSY